MQMQIFESLRSIIYRESGIVLPPEKKALLSGRINKRIRALGLKDESEYLSIIELDVSGDELIHLIDAISTNVTYFYREQEHFNTLGKILDGWQREGKQEVTIWCAAASSGEEPYTILFQALQSMNVPPQKLRLLATDICTKVLNRAVHGRYNKQEVERIPSSVRHQFMLETTDGSEREYIVKPEVIQHALFKKLNLVQFPYPLKGPFDVIFCRNVMIYFDLPTRQKIIREFGRLLAPGGYLFLSLSENLLGIEHHLESLGGSVYRSRGE